MKNRSNHALVGIFSLGALVLLLGFTVFTGGFSSLRDENERFVLVFHENVYGLHEGGKVTLNGVRIGRVERFFIGDAIKDGPVPVQVEINRKLVLRHMVEQKNEIFDEDGKFKKELIPRLMGQLIQESFVTGILYVNLTTENEPGDDPENPNKCMVVVQAPSVEALQEFFDKNVEAVAASGHIIESTQISFYNV